MYVYLLTGFMEVLSQMYVENCFSSDYQSEAQYYLQEIEVDLMSPQAIATMTSPTTDNYSKLMYQWFVNSLIASSCGNGTHEQNLIRVSNLVYISSLIEG